MSYLFIENLQSPINSFFIILIVGSLGLLSFLLVSNVLKVNRKANIFFGCFLAIWASFWFEEISILIHLNINSRYNIALHFTQSFVAILFYFSVVYFTNPYRKLTPRDLLHLFIPGLLIMSFLFKSSVNTIINWNNLFTILLLFQAFFYTLKSLILLKKHQKRVEFFNSNRETVDLNWIKQIIISLIGISIFITGYNLLVTNQDALNLLANSLLLIIIIYISFHAMAQKEIFIVSQEEMEQILPNENSVNQYKQKLLSNHEVITLKQELIKHIEKEKPYLEGDLSLSKLAGQLKLTPHHLSYVLNEGFNKNFFQFINHYRVEEAKKLLLSKEHEHLSMLGIAYDAGFNSKTAFNTVFKKTTGTTPSTFKKSSSHL